MEEAWDRVPDQLSVKERRRVVAYALKLEQAFCEQPLPQRQCDRPVLPCFDTLQVTSQGRDPGPFRLLEVFTWTCALSRAAGEDPRWEVWEPITLPRWDLMDPRVQKEALEYVRRIDPDVIWAAWPCSPWSVMQFINRRTPRQRRELQRKQKRARVLLDFVSQLAAFQTKRGRIFMGENPKTSRAWHEPSVQYILSLPRMETSEFHWCAYQKERPDTGQLIKKPTWLVGPEPIPTKLVRTCSGTHAHSKVEGSMRDGRRWTSVSEWAGGYTPAFARAAVSAMFDWLQAREPHVQHIILPLDDAADESPVDEATFEDADFYDYDPQAPADPEHPWSASELPDNLRERLLRDVPRAVRQQVRRTHIGLGHPSKETFLRMLRLGGASPVAQQYARAWQCPVCAESVAPARARPASTSLRPLAFNDTVAADLKYLRDAEGSKMVVLCIVDAGTAFQQAVLLRNRTPKHVAKRFVQTWIQPYGAPRVIVHDQGGQFQAVFLSMLDNWAIESQVAGSHAGWQASLIERHGSLLSTVWRKLVHQHRVAGRKHAKMALVACVLAKNA